MEILLIEDNPSDVKLLEEAFRELGADIKIRVARDGGEALAVFDAQGSEQHPLPRLVLLDLNLPKVNGHDVLARIKTNTKTRHIPVIVFTSSRADSDVRRAYGAYANAYLRKPTSLDGLISVVKQIKCFWLELAMLPPA